MTEYIFCHFLYEMHFFVERIIGRTAGRQGKIEDMENGRIPTVEQTPKVSVIIPVYNAEKYLRQCLDSVVNQTLREIEIICVDDGSTDGSLAILREYEAADSRVKVLTQKNQYAGVARNNGMAAAQGEYFAFLDADDFFELDTLESEYEQCKKYHADICLCGADKYNELTGKFESAPWWLNTKNIESSTFSLETNPKDIFQITNMAPWTKLFSAHFVEKYRLQFQALPRANDVYFSMVSLALAKRIVVLNRNLIHYRVGISTNLQSNNHASPLTFCKALSEVKSELQDKGVFDAAYDSFRNTALSLFSYNLRKVKNNQKSFDELRAAIRNRYLEEFHVATLRECDVQNKNDYVTLVNYLNDRGEKCSTLYQLYEKNNPNNPKVSIIIPVYNAECYLNDCLTSVCEQTFTDIEVICIDDKSTDNSLSILHSYAKKDGRVIVLTQTENTHQGGARNAGLDIAHGKYVWFIDADDYIDLDAVEILVKKMEALGDVDLLSFNCDAFTESCGVKKKSESGQIRRIWPKNRKIHLPADAKIIPDAIDGSSCTYFAKREFLDSFRFRPHVYYEDACFTFSALTSPGVFYEMDYAPYHRRIHDTSTTQQAKELGINCITDRIIALQDIADVIYRRELPPDHFGVMWFKKWARHCIDAYIERNAEDPQLDRAIIRLQDDWHIYRENTVWFMQRKKTDPIIISLTSYPPRIRAVHKTIETLLNQSLKADKVILWLAEEEFPNRESDLPDELLAQTEQGLEIGWCHNIRSYKKLIPALKAFPDAVIVTTDDDNYYHSDWLEKLYRAYLDNPECIQCHRITKVALDDNDEFIVFPGGKDFWSFPSYLNKLVGAGGVLYPPHCFHPDILDEERFMTLAPTSDDIWFWLMAALAGYRVNVVPDNIVKLDYVEGTQECALCLINDHGENYFWVHFKNILSAYPQLERRLRVAYQEAQGAVDISGRRGTSSQNERRLKYRAEQAEQEIRNIRASASYRIGRFITWIPRMVRGFFRCYQEHGASYTWRRVLEHLHIQKKPAHQLQPASPAPSAVQKKPLTIKKDYNYYQNLTPEQYPAELCAWFKSTTGQTLDLDNPRTFNEKLQWLKLYDSTPLKTRLADKYLVRDWVKEKIGEEYLIPLLGVWDSFDEIDFDQLPNQFVLKANHGCGWNIIVKDKSTFDKADAKKKFDTWMNTNFAYRFGLELQYMNIEPKIIAEEYLENGDNDLYDYKVFCFDGRAESIMFLSERKTGLKMAFYDLQWNKLPFTYSFPRNPEDIPKPQNLDLLISLAEKLSEGFAHVRVDFYILNDGTLKFGEMTFTSASGSCKWNPPEQNRIYGDLITLPPKSPIPQKLI